VAQEVPGTEIEGADEVPRARRLVGRVAVVTGAARGLGAATALRLAAEGASVAVVDATDATETVKALAAVGADAADFVCDVSDPDAVDALRDAVLDRFGRVDVLVNNAGILRDGRLLELSVDDWRAVLDVNLASMFHTCRSFVPDMASRSYGRIVNIASRSALGSVGQVNYSAAKAGVLGLTATLAMELGPDGITVNAVGPGYFSTPMTRSIAARKEVAVDAQEAEVARRTPLGRVGRPEEIASVVAFLASDDASYVSGQTLYVNGGLLTAPVATVCPRAGSGGNGQDGRRRARCGGLIEGARK
jgi:3-oxoacyl-[acyl-carrier protein] reductase